MNCKTCKSYKPHHSQSQSGVCEKITIEVSAKATNNLGIVTEYSEKAKENLPVDEDFGCVKYERK